MKVHVLLADSAQSDSGGKLHALGLGWTKTPAPANPMAVIVMLEFERPTDAAGDYAVEIRLNDDSGELATLRDGKQLVIKGDITFKPTEEEPGPDVANLVVNLGPGLLLEPERGYQWSATVDGHTEPHWSASFRTMSPQPAA